MDDSRRVEDLQSQLSRCGVSDEAVLELLLIGKTGHGKSSTANSILDEENVFEVSGETSSKSTEVQAYQKQVDGRNLFVVDTPGICDTRFAPTNPLSRIFFNTSHKEAERSFVKALSLTRKGYHAILLIFRYGERMTPEVLYTVKEMKTLLGDESLREHGVLVITNGDTFKWDMRKDGKSLEQWLKQEETVLRSLFEECNKRCVLFNNHTNDKNVLKRQRDELLKIVDDMEGHKRYTGGIFNKITEYWENGKVDPSVHSWYRNSSTIYFRLINTVRKTKMFDAHVLAKLREDVRKLNDVINNANIRDKKKLLEEIVKAQEQLDQLEALIKLSTRVEKNDSFVEGFVTTMNVTLNIAAAPLFLGAGVVATAVIGSLDALERTARSCMLQ